MFFKDRLLGLWKMAVLLHEIAAGKLPLIVTSCIISVLCSGFHSYPESLLQNQVTASQFLVNLIKLPFLKALTFMKDFTDNTKFNKCHSRIAATQNRVMK